GLSPAPHCGAPAGRGGTTAGGPASAAARHGLAGTTRKCWARGRHERGDGMTPALEGTRVLELGWAAAGPLVGTYLAQHGADVIHVESSTALDPFRSTYPPFRDNVVGPDRAGMFAFYNAGKRGVTLDLKQPRAVELAL